VLSAEREALVDLSATLATRDQPALERALRYGERFAARRSMEEVLLQAHLFVGFPLVLEAFLLWRRISPAGPPGLESEDRDDWVSRGEGVCRIVYGHSYEKLRLNVATLHPELDRWMVVGGYGRVIGRPGLDLATRELCISALLAVWGTPRQLHSHLRGAVNAGANPGEVTASLEIACRHLAPENAERIRRFWHEIAGRTRGPASGAGERTRRRHPAGDP